MTAPQLRRVYLDANATEPLRPAARAALLAALDHTGNPASLHASGRAARAVLEAARDRIAAWFGASPAGLVFCSGGTEANALAIHGLPAARVLIGATEHAAVHAAACNAQTLPVDSNGVIDLPALATALATIPATPALVCVMLANNETGTIQPIAAAAALCHAHGALLHVDAVQAAGRMHVNLADLGADSMAISSHKLGGPAGAGALLLRPGLGPAPLIAGGGQEHGRRGGTPPIAVIAGFAAALAAPPAHLATLRDQAEEAATACGAIVMGAGAARLHNTTCLALPGAAAQTQLIALDLAGIAVSAGAACSSGRLARSHVLDAMGHATLAAQAIRVSLPWNTQDADIHAFAVAYRAMASRLRRAA